MANTAVRIRYIGNHGGNLDQYYSYNDNPPDYVWYASTQQPLADGRHRCRRAAAVRQHGLGHDPGVPQDRMVELQRLRVRNRAALQRRPGLPGVLRHRQCAGDDHVGQQRHHQRIAGEPVPAGHGIGRLPGAQPLPELPARHQPCPSIALRWNWVADLPFGKGKWLGGNATGALDKVIGGWQLSGIGSWGTSYFTCPRQLGLHRRTDSAVRLPVSDRGLPQRPLPSRATSGGTTTSRRTRSIAAMPGAGRTA